MALDRVQPGKPGSPGSLRPKQKASATGPAFSEKLGEAIDSETRQSLDPLLEEVDGSSVEFGKRPNKDNLQRYRKAVGAFLDHVLKRAYKLNETYSTSKEGKTKVHLKIQVINENLEGLAELVLKKQAEGLMILKKLDAIRGMILDLYK